MADATEIIEALTRGTEAGQIEWHTDTALQTRYAFAGECCFVLGVRLPWARAHPHSWSGAAGCGAGGSTARTWTSLSPCWMRRVPSPAWAPPRCWTWRFRRWMGRRSRRAEAGKGLVRIIGTGCRRLCHSAGPTLCPHFRQSVFGDSIDTPCSICFLLCLYWYVALLRPGSVCQVL